VSKTPDERFKRIVRVPDVCQHCGSSFTRAEFSDHVNFCSAECRSLATDPKRSAFRIFERDTFRCCYCGSSSIEDDIRLHVDHILPYSQGGTDTAANLVTSCESCNVGKSDNPLSDDVVRRLMAVVKARNSANGIDGATVIKRWERNIKINDEERK
jgi:hypothetical protein